MKLLMTLLVRNEEDVVEANVRFHLECGVDLVLVTDNGSLDATRDLLAPFVRSGHVRLLDEPGDDYSQSLWVTRMAQLAAVDHAADWVVHGDADEFWWTDGLDLKRVLEEVPDEYGIVRVHRTEFLPCNGPGPFWERMVVSDTAPCNVLGRPLLPKTAHRGDPRAVVAQGNHEIVSSWLVPSPDSLPATIFHFPARSFRQFERKIVLGGRAYARNVVLPATTGNTWRALYAAYLEGRLVETYDALVPDRDELLRRLATERYVVDVRLRDVLRERVRPPVASAPSRERGLGPVWSRRRRRLRPAITGPVSQTVQVLVHSPAAGIDARLEERFIEFVDGARSAVDLVAFDVSATGVLAALRDAERRGVRVRVLTGVMGAEVLADWGLLSTRVAFGDTGATTYQRFALRDAKQVWTGSADLTPQGLHERDADCLVLGGPEVAETYSRVFRRLARGSHSAAASQPVVGATGFALLPAGDDSTDLLGSLVASARHVRVGAFTRAEPALVVALRGAQERGADVAEVHEPDDGDLGSNRLHHRFVVVDGSVVVTGAGAPGPSRAPLKPGADVVRRAQGSQVVLRSASAAQAYLAYWSELESAYGLGRRRA